MLIIHVLGLSEPGVPIGLSPSVGPRMMPELIDVAIAYATSEGYKYLLNTKGGDPTPVEVFFHGCFCIPVFHQIKTLIVLRFFLLNFQALSHLLRTETVERPRTLHTLFLEWKRILAETTYIGENGQGIKQTPGVYDSLVDDVYY